MPIDRKAALEYAKKFWNRAADDDKFFIGSGEFPLAAKRKSMKAPKADGWEVFFVRDGHGGEDAKFRRIVGSKIEEMPDPIARMEDLEDCTHYVSRCLLKEGINLKETTRANELAEAMLKSKETKTLALRTTKDEGQKVIDSGIFKPGDFIAYIKGKQQIYGHTAMFLGWQTGKSGDPGGITCHSLCRFQGLTQKWNGASDDNWFLHDGLHYTLVHFSEDDPRIAAATLKWLPGWWQLGSDFYFVWDNGRAFSTPHKPGNTGHKLLGGDSIGYYFEGGKEVVFIWRKRGGNVQVERWTAPTGVTKVAAAIDVTIDGASASATRVP